VEHQLKNIEKCPVCRGESQQDFLEAEDHNVSNDLFKIVECVACSFRFTNPIPTEETIGDYYKSENYVSHSGTKKGFVNRVYHIVRSRAIKQKENLAAKYSKEQTILDIGCGTGDFLGYCKSQNWKTLGLEPDQSARKIALESNAIDAKVLKHLYEIEANTFDVISMWHVLEHVYNLNEDIEQYKKILKKDGALIVAVPNCSSKDAEHYKSSWAAYDLPIHLYHFRPDNMKQLFSKHGMEVVEILPMKFDSYYISMVSEKYKGGNIFSGFVNGLKSNIAANSKNNKYSSQIYVIKHKKGN
jgi:2-polyprenyl-3-methyl-5-hydroxy-6-metoxy-1,4-benzoquinol methylase